MAAEPETKQGLMPAIAAGLALPILYVLSWGPVGALSERWGLEWKPLEIAYYPICWAAGNCPGAYEPLKWYWERFDSLRPDPDGRALALIYTSNLSPEAANSTAPEPAPSAYVISEDLQYFPPGPELKLTKQVEAIEAYQRRQQGLTAANESSDEVAQQDDESLDADRREEERKTEKSGAEK